MSSKDRIYTDRHRNTISDTASFHRDGNRCHFISPGRHSPTVSSYRLGMSSFRFYVSGRRLLYLLLPAVGQYPFTEHLLHTRHSSNDEQLQQTPEHNTTTISTPIAPFPSLLSLEQRQKCSEGSNLLRNLIDK